MILIKELTVGKYTLSHGRYVDYLDIERDALELFDNEKRVHIPFRGIPKVNYYKRGEPIKTTNDYTDEEYEEMLLNEARRNNHHGIAKD